jgi:hypothetical protein
MIGSLGRCIEENMIFSKSGSMSMEKIIDGIDLREGMVVEMILWGGLHSISQPMYYVRVTLNCMRFH